MLSDADYDYLYPFMSPSEIAEEYGRYSKGERTIQTLYKNKGYMPQRKALKGIVAKSYAIADLEVDENVWSQYVWKEIAKERTYRRQVVWERIRHIEGIYK